MFPAGKKVCGSLKNKVKKYIKRRSPLSVTLVSRTDYFPTLGLKHFALRFSIRSDRCSNRKTVVYFVALKKTRAVLFEENISSYQ